MRKGDKILGKEIGHNDYIEGLYHKHMWVSDLQYENLYDYLNKERLTDEELKILVDENTEQAKKSFSGVFCKMGNKEGY